MHNDSCADSLKMIHKKVFLITDKCNTKDVVRMKYLRNELVLHRWLL